MSHLFAHLVSMRFGVEFTSSVSFRCLDNNNIRVHGLDYNHNRLYFEWITSTSLKKSKKLSVTCKCKPGITHTAVVEFNS